jgi:hypothetical protein
MDSASKEGAQPASGVEEVDTLIIPFWILFILLDVLL